MRRWNALLVVWLVAISFSSGAGGQDTDAARSLTARQKWVRFAVVRGRITAFVTRGQGGAAWTEDKPDGASESFGICCESGDVKIRFERRTTDEMILMQFLGAREFSVSRMPLAADVVPLQLVQPPTGEVRLTIGTAAEARTITAPTLWHLFIVERELCTSELLPLLSLLRSDWRMPQQLDQLEQRLLTFSPTAPAEDLDQLIRQLGDPQFQVRQAADRRLRNLGQSILPALESMDTSRLDKEQRLRITAICKATAGTEEDLPQRLAQWLGNDKRLWQALATTQDPNWRSRAEQNLALLDSSPQQQGKLAESH